jgi:hypothetical protein
MMHASSSSSIAPVESRAARWRQQLRIRPQPHTNVVRSSFAQLVAQFPYPSYDDNDGDPTANKASPNATASKVSELAHGGVVPDLDPLTALVRETSEQQQRLESLELKYRKEKALRNRAGKGGASDQGRTLVESEDYDENAVTLQTIDKDLARLPPPKGSGQNGSQNLAGVVVSKDEDTAGIPTSSGTSDQRIKTLRRVLYIYACAHAEAIGYRQGMHEIASYILFALELEQQAEESLVAVATSQEQIASDAYELLETILTSIECVYDATPLPGQHEKPLEASARRVLQGVQTYDAALALRLSQLGVPPQLYLTKWMRLMYSREVTDVLSLWDELFAYVGEASTLVTVLEAVAVGRLLSWRDRICTDPDALHFLMNLPIETNMQRWLDLSRKVIHKQGIPLPPIKTTTPVEPATSIPAYAVPHSAPTGSVNSNWSQPNASLMSTPQRTFPSEAGNESGVFSVGRFSLSAVKEKFEQAKHTTQSLSKRLYDEWEQQQHHRATDAFERPYSDAFPDSEHDTPTAINDPLTQVPYRNDDTVVSANVYNGQSTPQRQSQASPPTLESQWASRVQSDVHVLQNYCMTMERSQAHVPATVWEALADLEMLRQDLTRRAAGTRRT